MKKLIISAAVLAGFAFAGNPNTGCGLGYMIFKNNQDSLLKQVLAVTTNGISGNQTFGITSGTLGCEKPAKLATNDKINNFVRDNLDKIAMDAARGEGESLTTLAKLLNVKDVKTFEAKVHQNFDKIFASDNVTYSQVLDNIAKYAI
ncbi:DUF3015 family protein [Caminibacter sp.]